MENVLVKNSTNIIINFELKKLTRMLEKILELLSDKEEFKLEQQLVLDFTIKMLNLEIVRNIK